MPLVGPLPQPGAPGHRAATASSGIASSMAARAPTAASSPAMEAPMPGSACTPSARCGGRGPPARRVRREVKWALTRSWSSSWSSSSSCPVWPAPASRCNQVAHINIAYVVAGVLLEAAASCAYAQLTYTVLPTGGPHAVAAAADRPLEPGREPRRAGRDGPGHGGCRTGSSPSPGVRAPTPASPWPCRAWARPSS